MKELWARYRPLAKSWAIFLGVLGLAAALDQWANAWVNGRFAELTAQVTAWILRLIGVQATVSGTIVNSSLLTFEVIGECTGYYPLAVFLAAVMAFPSSWKAKLLGIAAGVPAVLLVNQVRLVSLCYVNRWNPAMLETIHIVVWQSLMIFLVLFLWLLWVVRVAPRTQG